MTAENATSSRARALVGLMSGTSLDGIAAAVVRFAPNDAAGLDAELLAFRSLPYTTAQRDQLEAALQGASPEAYCRLDFDLGNWLAEAALAVISDAGVPRDEIDGVASHGQTIWHVPGHSTWQLGQSAVIAERTRLNVISDFRVGDVAAAGQGAPLVPMADAMLFAHATEWRALQNLGGIGNVTIVPPGGETAGVRAFDTGPGVVVIDGIMRALVPGAAYDNDGAVAREGRSIHEVVDRCLTLPYFAQEPPKSTGREFFSSAFIADFIAQCRAAQPRVRTADIVASAVALTARSIADAFARFIPEPVNELLVSGGGARNPTLIEAIARELSPRRVTRFSETYFDDEAKEAVAFALLGYLYLEGRAGSLPRVTGARGARRLGKLTPAR